ncbi:MAG TPA: hypothetical protein VGV07_17445 [Devosia sp.]|jgi:hypothetical protein|uniref:hypothetical protein n=1 Tax=Devosia sp. TaxID=1871048 RepID=UPI002DDD863C|nr:hypothetical protein [Devosia sp.]HEV2517043.1 hypothetical protein [Devosia sp.]
MEETWISAAEAYERVKKTEPFRAAQVICSRAHDGIIVARAQTFIAGDNRDQDVEVPAGFWWACGEAALTQKWASGDFETWIGSKFHCRAYGVTFRERDIAAMLPPSRGSGFQPGRARQGNFASSARCLGELQSRLGCSQKEAADHLVRFCRAGLIEGRCASFWHESTELLGLEEQELENVAIPAWFWEHCATEPEAILDWQTGTFAGRGRISGLVHKVRIKGAEFDIGGVVDLEIMLRERDVADSPAPIAVAASDSVRPSARPSRGGRSRSESWTDWIAELVSLIHEEGIPAGEGAEGQDALIGAIEERLEARGLDGLSRSTVQAPVRAVLVRLRSAGN